MTQALAATPATAAETRIRCESCGAMVHSIEYHLKPGNIPDAHEAMTFEEYKARFPAAPVLSPLALAKIKERVGTPAAAAPAATPVASTSVSAELTSGEFITEKKVFHELFELDAKLPGALSSKGTPVNVTSIRPAPEFADMVPGINRSYVFNVDVLKSILMGIEMKIPVYLWGHAGTGKTEMCKQVAARTGRPMIRVQHTANMEEEHVLGGHRLRNGQTLFELGPLPMAMKFGWLYLADEYDFGRPEVLSLYQPVLEGEPLVIKEADRANRVIKPHPHFRMIATGNTNGQGDETGLYNGTNMQNAANYERFGIVEQMPYMEKSIEANVIMLQTGIAKPQAEKLAEFAKRVRDEYAAGKLSNPISPRSLIYAAKIGDVRHNFRIGLEKAFIARLSSVDREAATQLAQRIFS